MKDELKKFHVKQQDIKEYFMNEGFSVFIIILLNK